MDRLLSSVDELAKGWLEALIAEAPLGEAPSIPIAEVVRDGPGICAAVVLALAADQGLERLQPGGELEPEVARIARLARVSGARGASRAVDTLISVVWAAARREIPIEDGPAILALAERTMLVAAAVRDAVLRPSDAAPAAEDRVAAAPVRSPPGPIEVPEPAVVVAVARADAGAVGEIGLSATVEHAIIRARRRDQQLAVLMVEVDDVEAVVRAHATAEATASAFASVAEAAKTAASASDVLIRETAARTWIVAPDNDATKAHALAGRVTSAVRALPPWCGVPLSVSVGIAVLDEDGADTTTLIDAADAARSGASATRE